MAQSQRVSAYNPIEWVLALGVALGMELALAVLLVTAGRSGSIHAEEEPPQTEVPMTVLPVIEDVPLLKLGSKRKEQQLPDMWRKPKPKRLYEDKSAPSVDAKKDIDKLPENEVAKKDEKPAPEDAELAKEVDEDIPEEEAPEDTTLPQEGSEQGVKDGTETDPLKAFVVSQYRMKLIAWFKAGFTLPSELDDATLCSLLARAQATVGSNRTVTSFTIQPSGNSVFDARVKAQLDRKQGQQLPPPPPNYPDILESIVNLNFSGETAGCKNKKPKAPAESDTPAPPVEAPGEVGAPPEDPL